DAEGHHVRCGGAGTECRWRGALPRLLRHAETSGTRRQETGTMSRIGKYPIEVPKGVTVTLNGQEVAVKGPKGELRLTLVDDVTVEQGESGLKVSPRDDSQRARAMWGLSRTLVKNLVDGVTDGFTKTLEINGVGYRAAIQGK